MLALAASKAGHSSKVLIEAKAGDDIHCDTQQPAVHVDRLVWAILPQHLHQVLSCCSHLVIVLPAPRISLRLSCQGQGGNLAPGKWQKILLCDCMEQLWIRRPTTSLKRPLYISSKLLLDAWRHCQARPLAWRALNNTKPPLWSRASSIKQATCTWSCCTKKTRHQLV